MSPLALLASGGFSALVYMLRDGAFDPAFLGASLAGLLLVAALKAPWYARAAGLPPGKALAGALAAGALSLAMPIAIAAGILDPKFIPFAAPGLLIAIAFGSTRYGRVLPDSPWDLLTPARLGLFQIAGAAMTTVWIAFAAGIEPSISPANFHLFRAVLQFIALLLTCTLAGLWDGAVLCTLAAREGRAGATSAAVRANLAILAVGLAAIWTAAAR